MLTGHKYLKGCDRSEIWCSQNLDAKLQNDLFLVASLTVNIEAFKCTVKVIFRKTFVSWSYELCVIERFHTCCIILCYSTVEEDGVKRIPGSIVLYNNVDPQRETLYIEGPTKEDLILYVSTKNFSGDETGNRGVPNW